MDIFDILRELQEGLAKAHAEIARLHWMHDNTVIHGKVVDVDPKKQLARVLIGENKDGKEVKSAWIPYSQIAGTRKVHSAPSKNQQMTLIAPNGDLAQAFSLPYTWHKKNPSPSEKGDEDIDMRGKTKRTQKDGSIKQEVDGVTREYTKQSKSTTVHKDPENKEEGKDEEVSDEKPWKGNRAKPLHVKKLDKDGGYELTINVKDKEHKIKVHPKDGIEHSFNKGKHKITIKEEGIKADYNEGKHVIDMKSDGITHNVENGKNIISILQNAISHSFDNGQHEVKLDNNGITHRSSQKVTIQAQQIEHNGDMMVSGSLAVSKVVQSAGFMGNLQGVASGIGFGGGLTPPTTW